MTRPRFKSDSARERILSEIRKVYKAPSESALLNKLCEDGLDHTSRFTKYRHFYRNLHQPGLMKPPLVSDSAETLADVSDRDLLRAYNRSIS